MTLIRIRQWTPPKKIAKLTKKLSEQMTDEKKLDEEIKQQLKNIGFNL